MPMFKITCFCSEKDYPNSGECHAVDIGPLEPAALYLAACELEKNLSNGIVPIIGYRVIGYLIQMHMPTNDRRDDWTFGRNVQWDYV